MSTLIITRHAALVQYLVAKGYVPADATVVSHASPEVVTGQDVWGVLPHSLSCLCNTFTEVPLDLPVNKRGVELSLEDMYQYAGEPVTYTVRKI